MDSDCEHSAPGKRQGDEVGWIVVRMHSRWPYKAHNMWFIQVPGVALLHDEMRCRYVDMDEGLCKCCSGELARGCRYHDQCEEFVEVSMDFE